MNSPLKGTFQTYEGADFVDSVSAQTMSGAKRGATIVLTSSSASVAIDLALSNNYSHTFTEDTTLAAPTNAIGGQSGIIFLQQHASAPKTLAFDSFWKFPGGAPAVPVTATNGAIDAMAYYVEPGGTFAICQMINDIKT